MIFSTWMEVLGEVRKDKLWWRPAVGIEGVRLVEWSDGGKLND